MSLRPTQHNAHFVGNAFSAKDWANFAIGSKDKICGPEGFENYTEYCGWHHPIHYKHISKLNPAFSPLEAADEMAEVRLKLVDEIQYFAEISDEKIKRLEKMQQQMSTVLNS